MTPLLIGTTTGLFRLEGGESTQDRAFGEAEGTALVAHGDEVWAIADRRSLMWRDGGGEWKEVARSEELDLTCLVRTPDGFLLGTEEAHLLRLQGGSLVREGAFDAVAGRDDWFTPWGGPPAVRSLAVDLAGRVHANVHVGGIPRSGDGGRTWEPTIEIEADVHQVLSHPAEQDVVVAAGAVGLCLSEDGGTTWRIEKTGLHSTYARAVAVAADTLLISASRGPRGGQAAVYRSELGSSSRLEKCVDGLPEWFDGNIDTGWLAAAGSEAAFATSDGRVFRSADAGASWEPATEGLSGVRWIAFA